MDAVTTQGYMSHPDGGRTWYQRTPPETPVTGALPLLVLHGGPGMAHDYMRRVNNLCATGREVIQYDQIGCGRSSHHPDRPASEWTVDLFVRELKALIAYLELRDGFHLLGQSWGGMLGPEFVVAHPEDVASLTLMNSPASMPAWAAGTRRLLANMPEDNRAAIERHEANGTYEHADYQAAVQAFYERHLCRLEPWPDDVNQSFARLAEDPSVYNAMIGPSEFTITGTLANWSVADRASRISVPTLVGYGEHDEATESWAAYAELIPEVSVHEFAGASHTPHLECPAEFDHVLSEFLAKHDPNRS